MNVSFRGRVGSPGGLDLQKHCNQVVELFEGSLKLAPMHRPTYISLIEAFHDWDKPEAAAAAERRLLEKFPEEFETLMSLADYHYGRQEPEPALGYARRKGDQTARPSRIAIGMGDSLDASKAACHRAGAGMRGDPRYWRPSASSPR